MRFEIPFDTEKTKKQAVIIFDSAWKRNLIKNNQIWLLVIPFLILGTLIVYGNNYLGYLFIAVAIYYTYRYFEYRNYYLKSKKTYYSQVDNHIKEYSSFGKPVIWDFQDENFCYSDHKYDLKISWFVLDSFKVLEDVLLIELRDNIIANFALNKEEVGEENFKKIINLLKEKIKSK